MPLMLPPPPTFLPVLKKVVGVYKLWQSILSIFPKNTRYSLGTKIDLIFVEVIESISAATFSSKKDKCLWIRRAITKVDTLKVLLYVVWEMKSIDTKKYILLSEPLEEIGKNLGGWYGQTVKQNSPID